MTARSRRLSDDEIAEQHAAELPNREAMSLISGYPGTGLTTGVTPDSGVEPTGTTGGGGSTSTPTEGVATYTDTTQDSALSQMAAAQQTAQTDGATTENVPNGQATSQA